MNILICGNYGAGNLGDELILKGLLKMLQDVPQTNITVMSANPSATEQMHHVKAVSVLPTGFRSTISGFLSGDATKTKAAIRQSDMILFGGGGLFNEDEPYSIYLWGRHAKEFHRAGKKYIIIGQSFAPLTRNWAKKTVQETINNAHEVFVRDQASQDFLYLLDLKKKVHVTVDPAFILDESDFVKKEEKPCILTVLRAYKGIEIEAARETIQKIAQELGQKIGLEVLDLDVGNIDHPLDFYWNLFQNAEMVFAMRLHAAILAVLAQRPFLALSYSPKVENMMKQLDLHELSIHFPLHSAEIHSKLEQPAPLEKIRLARDRQKEAALEQAKALTRILI